MTIARVVLLLVNSINGVTVVLVAGSCVESLSLLGGAASTLLKHLVLIVIGWGCLPVVRIMMGALLNNFSCGVNLLGG